MRSLLYSLFIFLLVTCSNQKSEQTDDSVSAREIKYAVGFKVTDLGENKLVEVTQPYQGATSGYKYLLVPKENEIPPHDRETKVVRVPIEKIVCTATTHIPLLDYIDETDKLVGFPTLDYISSPKARERIDKGMVEELGIDKGMNIEKIAVLKPNLVMAYTMTGDLGQYRKIEELGTPVVINAEYLERHPLGRAEWIKFMALFFNKEKEADSVFTSIEKEYMATKKLTENLTRPQPTVMSGIVYGDVWFLPGGGNYAAKLFTDAGCSYLWSDIPSNGYLELSFETVYEKAHDADLWIGVASFQSLQEIEDADKRYSRFKPFQTGKIYTYDARKGPKGGSEFLEIGYLRPDIILKDLVKIAHPELMMDYELYFHKNLE